jgi:divalent metal cation (Fe/Co/Zn/Cd) transporter
MSSAPQIPKQDTFSRIQWIQTVTIVWMAIEAAVSLSAAWIAHSPALLAFGGDSAVELISAVVVLRRFQVPAAHEQGESRAARIAGVLLFALAAYVAVASAMTLLGHAKPKQSYLGIAVLIVAAIFMPWLAKEKRRLSGVTGSAALRADAAESALCGYLSVIALVGLAVNAIWHVEWADPFAALCLVPFILREGWEAVQGKEDECCF